MIVGGQVVHDCPTSRSIGYFLEPVVVLGPFAKKPLQLTLRGITSDDHDLSVSLDIASSKTFVIVLELFRSISSVL